MSPEDLLGCLRLPSEACNAGRIPKKVVVEQVKPRPDERSLLEEGVEELQWLGNLKPSTIARSATALVTEIQVLALVVREPMTDSERQKLAWLLHRGIAHYPVFLAIHLPDRTTRLTTKTIGGTSRELALRESEALRSTEERDEVQHAFLASLALDRQPHADLGQLYQGWIDRLVALEVAREVGQTFRTPSLQAARLWESALRELQDARTRKSRVLRDLAKERQPARAAALSTERARLDGTLYRLKESLLEDPMPPSRR